MATTTPPETGSPGRAELWYAVAPDEVQGKLHVDAAAWHTASTSETFDNPKMNWTAAAELALAVMITQMDLFNRLLEAPATPEAPAAPVEA
jgi:hypothetical protein